MKVILSDKEAKEVAGRFLRNIPVEDVRFLSEGSIELKLKYGFVPVNLKLIPEHFVGSHVILRIEGNISQLVSTLNMKGKGWRLEKGRLVIDTSAFDVRVDGIKLEDGSMEIDVSV